MSGLIEVRDRVAVALNQLADPALNVTVHRDYAPDWLDPDLWKDNPHLGSQYTGRRVYVFAAGKSQVVQASRRYDLNEYRIEIVVLERYDGPEPTPPEAWVASRIDWVESQIYDYLGDARAYPDRIENLYPQTQEWENVYSYDLLREMKLFRSGLVFGFRRLD